MKYLIKRIQCVSGEVTDTHYVNIETNNIEATRKELHECYQCDRILFSYEQINKTQWAETRITLRWSTRSAGRIYVAISLELIRFAKYARQTDWVHLQPKYTTKPRLNPFRMNSGWNTLCLTERTYRAFAMRATLRYIDARLAIRKKQFRQTTDGQQSVLRISFFN